MELVGASEPMRIMAAEEAEDNTRNGRLSAACDVQSSFGACFYQQATYKLPVILSLTAAIVYTAIHHYQIFPMQDLYYTNYDRQQFMVLVTLTVEVVGALTICFISVLILSRVTMTSCLLVGCFMCVIKTVTVLNFPIMWFNIVTSLLLGMGKSLLWVIIFAKVTTIGHKLSGQTSTKLKFIYQKLFAIFNGFYMLSVALSSALNFAIPRNHESADSANLPSHHVAYKNRTYCMGIPSCLHLVPANLTSHVPTDNLSSGAVLINRSTIYYLILYLILGLVSAIILSVMSESINSPAEDDLTTRSCLTLLKEWKFAFVIPFMIYAGMVEGYVFLDHILVRKTFITNDMVVSTSLNNFL